MKKQQFVSILCLILLSVQWVQAQRLNLNNPEEALKAYRKVQCSLVDGEPAVYWWRGRVYSRVPGEKDRHLFNVQGMNIRACVTVPDANGGYGFRMVSREVMFYLDPNTDQVLRRWKNPWTGKEVEVLHVANDPVNMRAPLFARGPAGDYKFPGTFKDGQVLLSFEAPLFYTNPLGGEYQNYVGGTYHAMELFNWFLSEKDLLDATKDRVEQASVSWGRVSQWLPWLEMGDRPGVMIFHAAGMRLNRWDDLPEVVKQEIKQNYPIYQQAPPLNDQRPNETSWTYFKKVVEQRKQGTKAETQPPTTDSGTLIVLNPNGHQAASPEVALGPDGSINVIWVDRTPDTPNRAHLKPGEHTHRSNTNLYFARSTDGGRTFSTPVRVNDVEGSVWGFNTSKPRIAVSKSGTIHVFYSGNRRPAGAPRQAVDAMYTRSTDGGRTFEKPRRLNSIYQSQYDDGELDAAHCFGAMGVAPDGSVYVYWIDTREIKKEGDNGTIYGVVSRNDGKSFEPERKVFGAIACPCCQLWVTFSPDSKPYLSLRRVGADGSRDSAVARSEDKGKSYSEPVPVTTAKWMINGCPLKPTAMAVDRQGRLFAVYYTAGDKPAGVYFAVSEDGGKTFAPHQLLHPEAKVSDHPGVAVGPDDSVYVFWDARVGEERRVYMKVSTDHGKSFGPAIEFGAPEGSATYPSVAVGKDGVAYVAWQQNDRIMFQTWPTVVAHRH